MKSFCKYFGCKNTIIYEKSKQNFSFFANLFDIFSNTIYNQFVTFVNMNVIYNIKKIRNEKNISQEVIALALGFDVSNWNKIENGKQQLKVNQLEKIAQVLDVRVIDLFTYPERYLAPDSIQSCEKISVTFEISPEHKELLLRLIDNSESKKNSI